MMVRTLTAWALILGIVVMLPFSAARAAEPVVDERATTCGPRSDIVEYIRSALNEAPVAQGVTFEGELLELFVSQSGTWTAVLTGPGGDSCVATYGNGWEILKESRPVPGPSA